MMNRQMLGWMLGVWGIALLCGMGSSAYGDWGDWASKFRLHPKKVQHFDTRLEKDCPRPAEDAETQQCEPIRKQIAGLNRRKYLYHFATRPEIAHLQTKYRACLSRIENQEYDYLKHVELTHPELENPPLKAPEDALGEPAR